MRAPGSESLLDGRLRPRRGRPAGGRFGGESDDTPVAKDGAGFVGRCDASETKEGGGFRGGDGTSETKDGGGFVGSE